MNLKGINSGQINPYQEAQVNQQNQIANKPQERVEETAEKAQPKKSDKLELSAAAKKLHSSGLEPKRFAEIQERIKTGYYDSNEVLNKVADSILKEISGQ